MFPSLTIMNNPAQNISRTNCRVDIVFSIPLGLYPGVELPAHTITRRLIFGGTAKLFFDSDCTFYTRTSNA